MPALKSSANVKKVHFAQNDGQTFLVHPSSALEKLSGTDKEILDKEFVRMVNDHNLPSRLCRYEGFRQ